MPLARVNDSRPQKSSARLGEPAGFGPTTRPQIRIQMSDARFQLKKRWLELVEAEAGTDKQARIEDTTEGAPARFCAVHLKLRGQPQRTRPARLTAKGQPKRREPKGGVSSAVAAKSVESAEAVTAADSARAAESLAAAKAAQRARDAQMMPPPPPPSRASPPGPRARALATTPPLQRTDSLDSGEEERPLTPESKRHVSNEPVNVAGQAKPPNDEAVARVATALGLPQGQALTWFKENREALVLAVKMFDAAKGSMQRRNAREMVAQCVRALRANQSE